MINLKTDWGGKKALDLDPLHRMATAMRIRTHNPAVMYRYGTMCWFMTFILSQLIPVVFKGTVSSDFLPLVFFIKQILVLLNTNPWVKAFCIKIQICLENRLWNCRFYGQRRQWHRWPLVGGVSDTVDQWWAASLASLSTGGRCQWHHWPNNFFKHLRKQLLRKFC
jgi:hypothetical protein